MNSFIFISALVLWFLIGLIISYLARKSSNNNLSEFFVAGKKLNGFVSALTYSATTYSSFMMIGLVSLTYKVGVSAMGFELTYLISTILLLLYFSPKFWAIAKKYDVITPSQLLEKRYGSHSLALIVTFYSLFMLIPYMSVQFTGIGYLLQGLANIPYLIGVTIAFVIIVLYTLLGGMRSVAWTDTLQSLIMIISSIALLLYFVYFKLGGFGNLFLSLEKDYPKMLSATNIPYQKFLGLSIPWMFFALTNPQVSQRMFIPKDISSLKKMIIGFAIFGFVYTFIVINLGLAAKCIFPHVSNPEMMTSILLSHTPIFLSLFVFVGIIAASVSTVNSITLTLSSMATVDIFSHNSNEKSEKKALAFGKWMVPVIAAFAFFFAIGKFGLIVNLSVISSAGLLAVAPTYIGIFWKKSSSVAAISSILLGGFITLFFYFFKIFPFGIWPGVWSAIVSTLTFIIVSLLFPGEKSILNSDEVIEV